MSAKRGLLDVGPLFWQSVLALIYRFSGAVITFVFGVTFARIMSIEQYGALVSLMSFATVAAIIGGGGQQLRVLLEIPSHAAQRNYRAIRSIVAERVYVTCLGSMAMVLIASIVFISAHGRGEIFGRWEYATSLLLVLPLALIELQSSVARALGSVNLALVPKDLLWRLLTIMLAGALFVTYGHPPKAADVLMIAAGVLVLLLAAQQGHLRRLAEGHGLFTIAVRRPNDPLATVLFTSVPFWVTGVASMLFSTVDVVIVSVMVNPESGGYYYAASRISLLLDFFIATFCVPAAPLIARLFNEDLRSEITRVTSGGALAALIAVLGCFVALAVFGEVALMTFGQAFVHAQGVMMILAGGQVAATYFGVGSIALNMTGHQRAAMYIMVITSVLGMVAIVGATWKFGIWGTAVVAASVNVTAKAWMAAHIYAAEGIDLTATTMLCATARRASRVGTRLFQEALSIPTDRPSLAGPATPSKSRKWRWGATMEGVRGRPGTCEPRTDLRVGGNTEEPG